jgi:hypothetical protein
MFAFGTAASSAHLGTTWVAVIASSLAAIKLLPGLLAHLVLIFTKDPERRRACLESIRLHRRDAVRLPSYIGAAEREKPASAMMGGEAADRDPVGSGPQRE